MFPTELELRDSPRKPFHCPAWITVGNRTVACKLIDLSETGAGLSFLEPGQIPDSFTLHLSHGKTVVVPCHVVWRKDRQIGVAFFNKPETRTEVRARVEVSA